MRTESWGADVKQVGAAGVLSLYNISTLLSSKIRPIARRKEFWSFQWELRAGRAGVKKVRSAGVLSLSNISTRLSSKIRPIARRKELCSLQWELWPERLEQSRCGRPAGVVSRSNKHTIILQNPTNSKAEFWSVQWELMTGARSGAVAGGWSSFPIQYKHMIILQNPTNRKAERILLPPMRTEDWGPEWSRCGRLEFFPYPI